MLFVLDKTCDKTRGLQNPHGRHHERGDLVRDAQLVRQLGSPPLLRIEGDRRRLELNRVGLGKFDYRSPVIHAPTGRRPKQFIMR